MIKSVLHAVLLAAALCLPVAAQAHGTQGKTGDSSGTVCAAFSYDDGGPMSYSAVEVFSPADPKMPFQTGRTDRNGWFCFRPDASGRWKLTAKDEEGHQVRMKTSVSLEEQAEDRQ
jgi:nickel transport protein